jgi:hypothetical protein
MTAEAGNDTESGQESPEGAPSKEFEPITSQEQLDQLFNRRWAREQAKIHEQYKGFDEIKAKAERFDELEAANQTESQRIQAERESALQKAAEAEARAAAAEQAALRQRIAIEEGLPPKFASRLTGETEDELRADAKKTFGDFIATPSFDHGPRSKSAPKSMNDLIFGAAQKR